MSFKRASLPTFFIENILQEPIEDNSWAPWMMNASDRLAFRNISFQTDLEHNSSNTSLSLGHPQGMINSEKVNHDFLSSIRFPKREFPLPKAAFSNLSLLDLIDPAKENAIDGIDDFKNPVFANVTPSGSYKIDSLLSGWKWPGNTITYSFQPDDPGFSSEIDATTKDEIRHILENVIEPLINIDFQEVFEAAGDEGQIRYSYGDINAAGVTISGNPTSVYFKEDLFTATQAEAGNSPYEVILHETLHALGLKHPGNYNGESIGNQEPPFLPEDEDHTSNTVMSYHDGAPNVITPMVYDVMALRYLYGHDGINGGDSTYEFERPDAYSLNGQFFGGAPGLGGDPIGVRQTLSDAFGVDTLDFQQLPSWNDYLIDINTDGTGIVIEQSQFNVGTYTHLVNGQQYSHHGLSTAISTITWIENVIGSGGNDEIIGNDIDNTLSGGKGNDELTGKYGFDLLVGEAGDDILRGSSPSTPIDDGDEVDTLYGGPGSDIFVIGDPGGKVYYTGAVRYASIMDFNQAEKDLIQLSGSSKDYTFDDTWPGGVGIFYQAGGTPNDLVAEVVGANSLNIQTDIIFV